ncbi:MAG: c-type cytochrome [Gemmatimonas sp.]|jgi:hypothetical protein|uniref:c-type cytochrome n=1 Tax=Gemmatimonas sp. TaxID=1962908 RepID=UPI00391F3859|nr:c-type cytochrome [Gemmatimonadota bacterium]
MRSLFTIVLVAAAMAACARTQQEAPVAEARPIAAAAGAPATAPAQRRQPVSPMKQDTVRKQAIAELMAALQGRENEPAGVVFKNVKLHKSMPAREFLTMMDEQYGRGLGMTCTNCHLDNKDYASDERKNKVIARQMERMQRDIDAKYIAKVKELDDPRPKTTCVMCHRGVTHMPNTMDVPEVAPPQRKRG